MVNIGVLLIEGLALSSKLKNIQEINDITHISRC